MKVQQISKLDMSMPRVSVQSIAEMKPVYCHDKKLLKKSYTRPKL